MIADRQVPWAWAIDGCVSLISAVVTTQLGFTGVVARAAWFYLTAAAAPRSSH
jgi:uncharacterized membrane protein YtjA (UPF0391 family)